MMTIQEMRGAEFDDARLVAESLKGNRDAFRQIVEQYQTLIASLAYSATGSMTQSEDLAQETFVRAWTDLAALREPSRLRSWLCSIARFVISKQLRRQGREPVHRAEPLEAVDQWASAEPAPAERLMSEEEKAMLWRSLEHIPEIYREPLVLFYREHQSIAAVARDLDLSEDAVKQRLSRGRKLLHERLLRFVEGALEQTTPGKVFTLAVMAALPLGVSSATAATVTAAASKSGPAAKAAAGSGMVGAFLSGQMMLIFSFLGVLGFAGRWMGRKMGLASRQSTGGRRLTIQLWRSLAIGFLALVVPVSLVRSAAFHTHPWLVHLRSWSLAAFCLLLPAALVFWTWHRREGAGSNEPQTAGKADKAYNLWVVLGMLGPAYVLGAFLAALFFSNEPLSSRPIGEAEAQRIVSERPEAQFAIHESRNGYKYLYITLPEHRRNDLATVLSGTLERELAAKRIVPRRLVEGVDFENGGVHAWLMVVCTLIFVAGVAVLARRPGTEQFYRQELETPRAELREKKVLAVGGALSMLAVSLLLVAFTVVHSAPTISGAEAERIIKETSNARFEVYEYKDGEKALWITLPGIKHPRYITPADRAMLAFLADHAIPYHTEVQGRDFGFRGPGRFMALSSSGVLTALAVVLLSWVARQKRQREPVVC